MRRDDMRRSADVERPDHCVCDCSSPGKDLYGKYFFSGGTRSGNDKDPMKKTRTDRARKGGKPVRKPRHVNASRARPAVPHGGVPIVGIGASAGGLDAFSHLLRALPANPGMALVLVQHLSPTHPSALPELLAKVTSLPVEQVRNGTRIAVDHVYIVPPNAEMTVADGHLRLRARPTDRP